MRLCSMTGCDVPLLLRSYGGDCSTNAPQQCWPCMYDRVDRFCQGMRPRVTSNQSERRTVHTGVIFGNPVQDPFTHPGPKTKPVRQVLRVRYRRGEAHEAHAALRVGADVAHAGDDDLQDGPSAHKYARKAQCAGDYRIPQSVSSGCTDQIYGTPSIDQQVG